MTKEEYKAKVEDLKDKYDAFIEAAEEVFKARKLEMFEPIFLEEIEYMGNSNKLEKAQSKIRQLRLLNGNRS